MPASSSKPAPAHMEETRRNYDKRALRKKHAAAFTEALAILKDSSRPDPAGCAPAPTPAPAPAAATTRYHVLVRKRPLLGFDRNEFDVVAVQPGGTGVTVYDCRCKADQKTPCITTCHAPLQAFGETSADQEVVCALQLEKLVAAARRGACTSAVCTLGQTGSGKTHTLAAVLGTTAHLLFNSSSHASTSSSSEVFVKCYEVYSRKCYDLLDGRKDVPAREDCSGNTQVLSRCVAVSSAAEFSAVMARAKAARTTQGTARNADSSRSHAFYEISFENCSSSRSSSSVTGEPVAAEPRGRLLLVDLAGSERSSDSLMHDKLQQQQSNAINAGLGVLKECFRLLSYKQAAGSCPLADITNSQPQHMAAENKDSSGQRLPPQKQSQQQQQQQQVLVLPWRETLLTRLLRCVLDPPRGSTAQAVLLATLSPCSSDTEASLNTLRYACIMAGCPVTCDADLATGQQDVAQIIRGAKAAAAGVPSKSDFELPGRWSHGQLQSWMRHVDKGAFADTAAALPASVDGRLLARAPELRFRQLCGGSEQRGARLFRLFRDAVSSASSSRAAAARAAADASGKRRTLAHS